ncbi:hypothetical protein [Sphingomonas sp. Leaf4]|uniref:hypothetical protein n=1 Tax=Sphingomonas sp. Leaf4 TaxID=2876553 RepID=UPI001E57CD6C|nr:hypothetical protein [Sphingomonas sp. Leaf4]
MNEPVLPDDPGPWWRPNGLTWAMWALVAWCGIAGAIGLNTRITDSDPAGNGMATGMIQGLAMLLLAATGIVVGLYLLIRWRPLRYVCVGLLTVLAIVSTVFMR